MNYNPRQDRTVEPAAEIDDPRGARAVAAMKARAGGTLHCFQCPARTSDLCSGLPDRQLEDLFAASTRLTLGRGQTLVFEGDPANHVYNISRGTMMLTRLGPDGRRQILAFLFRGHMIGFTAETEYRFNAEAVSDVELCRFDKAKLEELFCQHAQLEKQFRLVAMKVIEANQELIFTLGRRSAVERVAAFLLFLEQTQEQLGEAGKTIPLPMTRTDIADYLGLTIETVSRAFTKLKTSKAIRLPTLHSVEIVRRDELADLAGAA